VVLIGLLLIAVGAGFTADVFLQNSQQVTVDVLGRDFTVGIGWVVVAGIVALAVFVVGVRLVVLGVSRARRRKTMLRNAEVASRERDRLAQELAAERGHGDEGGEPAKQGELAPDAVTTSID
jgi:hypothetical protein